MSKKNNFEKYKGEIPPNFCSLPFIALTVSADGQCAPCCRYRGTLNLNQDSDTPIADIWNDEELVTLRETMRRGERTSACASCWEDEDCGRVSYRMRNVSLLKYYKGGGVPRRLEVFFDNKCNLKCRICSPRHSSSLTHESVALTGEPLQKDLSLKFRTVEEIGMLASELVELSIAGGEPFLSEMSVQLIDLLSKSEHAKNIALIINTNCSIFESHHLEVLQAFRKVHLNFSLDDIGARLEYQRKGLKWEKAKEVIRRYYDFDSGDDKKGIYCKICYTASIFNTYYLPEFMKVIKDEFGLIPVFINILSNPTYYAVNNFPEDFKKKIVEYLVSAEDEYIIVDSTNRDLIEFCNQPPVCSTDTIISAIREVDEYRSESFAELMPDVWEALS